MVTYKYKLYRTDKTKHLDKMLREACFVWNHALALQKRYYRLFKKYIPLGVMQKHQAKRIKRNLLGAQTVQEILERLDIAYKRFFEHLATRPLNSVRQRILKVLCLREFTTNVKIITTLVRFLF